MVQEVGETRNAIIEDDNKRIESIVRANRNRKNPYWIVLFAKPWKQTFEGKPVLVKHLKPYAHRPSEQVGQIIGEVDNTTGTIRWSVNMPQRPFDFDALKILGASPCDEVVTETTSIPGAYLTQ